jgi:hypothetical protein
MLGLYIADLEPGDKLGPTEILCIAFSGCEYARSNQAYQPLFHDGGDGGTE